MNSERSETDFIREQLKSIFKKIESLENEIRSLRENHIHHLDLRVERMETSLSIGWKAILFGAGVPAFISAILSIINLVK
jgi:hypothetical protein|tara:strand:+ start:25 stop:264 length:240 start_codon:yes stop_codon:yes gene_type:complete